MSNKCDCGGDAEAAEIVGRNEFAFKVGVWWFATGSNQVIDRGGDRGGVSAWCLHLCDPLFAAIVGALR